ncbi:MAG: hydroxymethylglutaryl-CoA lyase [Chloroflexota bacterium]|nr:hydroxymethylglutaryl-CoA lyase [Chloroflexota bacterium]
MTAPVARQTVTVVEVGPRDGLQNEDRIVPIACKIAFVESLADSGLQVIETTSFVHPSLVPQLADAEALMLALTQRSQTRYVALVPNERGYDRARSAGTSAIALFTAATEEFSQANIRCSIDESFQRFAPVVRRATAEGVWVRGYVSVAFTCPYSGRVPAESALRVAARLIELGCDQVALADTIGGATTEDVDSLMRLLPDYVPIPNTALHFHDTRGEALANVGIGLSHGVRVFDGAAGGLGGCPFAPGAAGNLSTERLVAFLEARGYRTGVNAAAVTSAGAEMRKFVGTPATAIR